MVAKIRPPKTPVRHYDQYCPVARSLDVLGERWTLLIVRDLLMGPQRYTDLREAQPAIATDLLTARLRTLEDAGYVQRRELPRPARVTVYELTDSGRRLGRVVVELARLGLEQLGAPAADQDINAEALILSLRASMHPGAAQTGDSYQVELDGETYAVNVADGHAETARGPAHNPESIITTSSRTLAQLLSGQTDPHIAIATGELEISGPPDSLDRFLDAFKYPRRAPATRTTPV